MKRRQVLIEKLNGLATVGSYEFEMDNLDSARLYKDEEGITFVINEHDESLELDDLSDAELETSAVLEGIEMTWDYVVMDENNVWLMYGEQETLESIENEAKEFKEELGDTEILVFYAKELSKLKL